MKTIEIAGPVGAGKSSVVGPLQELLAAGGCEVLTLDSALARIDPGLTRWSRWAASARFGAANVPLLVLATRALLRAPIPGWHRRRILQLLAKLGTRLELIRTRLPADTIVILDEGWLHRALNLFAWRADGLRPREIDGYLDRARLSPIVVFVEAPAEVTRSRTFARGLPKRLRGRSTADVDAFLTRGQHILDRACDSLHVAPRGVRIVRVVNAGRKADLAKALERALSRTAPTRAPLFSPAWPGAPRPDRVLQRLRRRRSSLLPIELAARVAAQAGLVGATPAAPRLSPGGRGAIRSMRDRSGVLWLVKRYKETLSDSDISTEHAVLWKLAEMGLPAPRLLNGPGGSPAILRMDDGRFALFAFAEGYEHPHERIYVPRDRRRLDHLAGQLLGALHDALRGFEPPARSDNGFSSLAGPHVRPAAWFVDRLASSAAVSGRGSVMSRDERVWLADELVRLDRMLMAAELPRTVIHGDYGPYNLLVRSGREPLPIDWELARVDWRLTDLATAVPRFSARRTGWDSEAAGRFLAGYRASCAIDAAELSLLPAVAEFLAIRRAVVCLGRFLESADVGWRSRARDRLELARSLANGRHPLVEVSRR